MTKKARSENDLQHPIPDALVEHHMPPTGNPYLIEVDGILHVTHVDTDLFLGKRMIERLRAEQNWFEKLIRHPGSVGTFYEDTLRALLKESLPSTLRIGTGFIFDPNTRCYSKQIDILIYDTTKNAPAYERGDFVVIFPWMAVSQTEVKKHLKIADVRSLIQQSLLSYYGNHPSEPAHCHRIAIFAYSCTTKTQTLFNVIVEEIERLAISLRSTTVSGKTATISIQSMVLPSFYFFDRGDYIETRLERQNNYSSYRLTVSQFSAQHDSSLNEYFDHALNVASENDLDERNFRTLPYRNVLTSKTIKDDFLILQRVPMLKILNQFPADSHALKSFRIKGRKPYEVVIPGGIKLSSISRFHDFLNIKELKWLTLEDSQ